jgi:hypothetical protein
VVLTPSTVCILWQQLVPKSQPSPNFFKWIQIKDMYYGAKASLASVVTTFVWRALVSGQQECSRGKFNALGLFLL